MLTTNVKTEFDKPKVKRAASTATFKSLGALGGALRKTASRMIRKGKKPSAPGRPPHTQTGELREGIRYDVDKAKETVVVGPTKRHKDAIWHLHEFGGIGRKHFRRLYEGPYETGKFGPIRLGSAGKFGPRGVVWARLDTDKQAARAAEIAKQANAERTALEQVVPHYPKRPFMAPALEKLKPRIPSFWANSVRS